METKQKYETVTSKSCKTYRRKLNHVQLISYSKLQMYQVIYNGLRKRESYEEIVAILEHDTTKLQYPDRVQPGKKRRYPYIPDAFNARLKYSDRTAMQIMNSPYMKQ